jgi:predicted RecB family nuclease
MWRGGGRSNISVAAPFVWRCLTGSAVAPFPQYKIVTVPLAKVLETVRHSVIQVMKQQKGRVQPPLVLNKHCTECEFRARCRRVVVEKDDLSLFGEYDCERTQKLNNKGIFTVTQLS